MCDGYNVLFEVLSVNDGKKEYTDLVIDLGDNRYIAIELKYKSAEKPQSNKDITGYDKKIGAFYYEIKNDEKRYIFPQGASDEGSYRFLRDVERLENFIYGKTVNGDKKCFNFGECNQVIMGYAIIIASSRKDSKSAYWNDHPGVKWADFSLYGKLKKNKELKWVEGKYDSITLRADYECNWEDYYAPDGCEYPLKYMIFEIKRTAEEII